MDTTSSQSEMARYRKHTANPDMSYSRPKSDMRPKKSSSKEMEKGYNREKSRQKSRRLRPTKRDFGQKTQVSLGIASNGASKLVPK